MKHKKYIWTFFLLILCATAVYPEEIYIASGAGYKRMLQDIIVLYKTKGHKNINAVYGNMQQIITQAKQSRKIRIMIGDSTFLKKSGIPFATMQELGQGTLILAFRKRVRLKKTSDITSNAITKIMLPDPRKAIYGKAAVEHLKYYNTYEKVKKKLLIVKTVPQVSAYLVHGETDAGFINYSDYTAISKRLGGYIPVDKKSYSQIIIAAAVIDHTSKDVTQFLLFLKTKDAIAILKKYGVMQK